MPQIDETKPISQIGKTSEKKLGSSPEEQASVAKDTLENISIRTMPKKFKISSEGQDGKTKVVGAVIMVVGAFVLIALVYLAYIYLIKPAPKKPEAETPVVVEKEIEEEIEKPKEAEKKQEPVEKKEPVASKPKIEDVATTTPEIATTTIEDVASGADIIDTDSDGLTDGDEV